MNKIDAMAGMVKSARTLSEILGTPTKLTDAEVEKIIVEVQEHFSDFDLLHQQPMITLGAVMWEIRARHNKA